LRPGLNLDEEAIAQLLALLSSDWYEEFSVLGRGRESYAAERLRLLYVSITRAREELIFTWNVGRFAGSGQVVNSVALPVLHFYDANQR
jgi:ATP-dependent exoDNAse (exonuclease V) beta subunit